MSKHYLKTNDRPQKSSIYKIDIKFKVPILFIRMSTRLFYEFVAYIIIIIFITSRYKMYRYIIMSLNIYIKLLGKEL